MSVFRRGLAHRDLKGRHSMADSPHLRIPKQAVPVYRGPSLAAQWIVLPAFIVTDVVPLAGGGTLAINFIPEDSPIRDSYSYFAPNVDQRMGVCSILSGGAAAYCARSGGLF
jgi:hypothetical protein